jgi:formylmethanofuran dehydrogenase subunit E
MTTDIHERETQEITVVKMCQACGEEIPRKEDERKIKGHTVCTSCEDAYWEYVNAQSIPKAGE